MMAEIYQATRRIMKKKKTTKEEDDEEKKMQRVEIRCSRGGLKQRVQLIRTEKEARLKRE